MLGSPTMPEPFPRWRRLLYSLGAPGWGISDRIVVGIALYFYLPPPGRGLEPQVSEGVFLGALTVFGGAMLVGRIFDSLADPLVGHFSDRSRSRLGRRRSFLLYGILPMVGIPVLLFWPPGAPGSDLNGIALAVLLSLYFIAFTVYVAPYLALLPELARSSDERVKLATLLALLSFPIMSLYNVAWPSGIELGRQMGLSSADALRGVVVVSALFSLVLCALPILAVDEDRFTKVVASDLPLRTAFSRTVTNRPFLIYLAAQLLFIFSVNLISPAMIYYATVVLGRSEGFAALLGLPLFGMTVIAFPVIQALTRRLGPKATMITCVLVSVPAFGAFGLMVPDTPGGEYDLWNLTIAWTALCVLGFPVAGFLVLPYLLISQLIDEDAERTGANRAAMYFGMQGLLTKWMYGFSIAVLAFLFSRFGKSPEQATGVLLVGPLAALGALCAGGLFALYPERLVLRGAREMD